MGKKKITFPTFDEYAKKVADCPRLIGGYRSKGLASVRKDIPLVSIITVTHNTEKTLLRTLDSVRAQTYQNIEHIIIDGGSTDGTLELIQANEDAIAYWRSERDNGIYDAFNKGVVLTTGQYIGILNADDYYEPDQIESAVAVLLKTEAPFVHGDIVMHGWKGLDVPLLGDPDYASRIAQGMPAIFQVTVLCQADVFKRCGLFSTRYLVAGDFEWFLRLAQQGYIGAHSPSIRAHMQAGGISTTRQRRTMLESGLIIWQHGLPLGRAVRLTLPRVIFPNGNSQFVSIIKEFRNNPGHTLWKVIRKAINALTSHNKNNHPERRIESLLDVFLNARQVCSSISPLGLEWLYGIALQSRTYFIKAAWGPEVSAAKILLQGGGSRQVPTSSSADVLLLDVDHMNTVDLQKEIRYRTVLAVNNAKIPTRILNLPHRSFGSLLIFGTHLNADLSRREAL